jgi:hypothetical protein
MKYQMEPSLVVQGTLYNEEYRRAQFARNLHKPSELATQAEAIWIQDRSYAALERRIQRLENLLKEVRENQISSFRVNTLKRHKLTTSIDVIIEPDDDGFIVRNADIPIYGYGVDSMEAVECFKEELENLYEELMEDDDFTDEWLAIKEYLSNLLI